MEAEFLTCTIDLPFFNFYTQLSKSGMKNIGRISKHDIGLVEKFLELANGLSNSCEAYFEVREVSIPSLT